MTSLSQLQKNNMSTTRLSHMRIALIGPKAPPNGGMANQMRQLAQLLAAEGASVFSVAVNPPFWPSWVGSVPLLRAFFRVGPYLARLFQAAGHCDVFHIMANSGWSWHLFAAPAIWVAHCRGIPVVVNYRGGEAAEFLRISAPLVRFSMRRASALVVPSLFLESVFKQFGMAASVVPNIIDLSLFYPRKTQGVGPPHLLVTRNLEKLYDIETALRCFSLVANKFPQARLTVAGSGPEEASLKQWVTVHGLTASVCFTGPIECNAMAALYRNADLVLNPSLADNMPNSLLEAWASGVPVVSTNVGGIPYMVQDGVTASLVHPSDPDAMAQACVALLCDQSLWQARALAGLKAAQLYSWTCVKPKWADVYGRSVFRPIS